MIMGIIDHVGITISHYEQSKQFFSKALAPLNITLTSEFNGWGGFGRDGKPEFWIHEGENVQKPMHLAFLAQTRAQVEAFYTAALEAGAKDNGAPGIRPHYHPNYFGAFVIGPDGHNVEAVCHAPQ
jgi:catechol 2,3-dioxygenase-like lactoylglutathione lyase family enzyme